MEKLVILLAVAVGMFPGIGVVLSMIKNKLFVGSKANYKKVLAIIKRKRKINVRNHTDNN